MSQDAALRSVIDRVIDYLHSVTDGKDGETRPTMAELERSLVGLHQSLPCNLFELLDRVVLRAIRSASESMIYSDEERAQYAAYVQALESLLKTSVQAARVSLGLEQRTKHVAAILDGEVAEGGWFARHSAQYEAVMSSASGRDVGSDEDVPRYRVVPSRSEQLGQTRMLLTTAREALRETARDAGPAFFAAIKPAAEAFQRAGKEREFKSAVVDVKSAFEELFKDLDSMLQSCFQSQTVLMRGSIKLTEMQEFMMTLNNRISQGLVDASVGLNKAQVQLLICISTSAGIYARTFESATVFGYLYPYLFKAVVTAGSLAHELQVSELAKKAEAHLVPLSNVNDFLRGKVEEWIDSVTDELNETMGQTQRVVPRWLVWVLTLSVVGNIVRLFVNFNAGNAQQQQVVTRRRGWVATCADQAKHNLSQPLTNGVQSCEAVATNFRHSVLGEGSPLRLHRIARGSRRLPRTYGSALGVFANRPPQFTTHCAPTAQAF